MIALTADAPETYTAANTQDMVKIKQGSQNPRFILLEKGDFVSVIPKRLGLNKSFQFGQLFFQENKHCFTIPDNMIPVQVDGSYPVIHFPYHFFTFYLH